MLFKGIILFLLITNLNLEIEIVFFLRFKIDSKQVPCALSRFKYEDTDLADKCATLDVKCNETQLNSPFRTLDGSCNNVENLIWGRSNSQYMRILNSEFNDGKLLNLIGYIRWHQY